VKITILCENTAPPGKGVLGEHGFSALIETDAGNYLFDTGQGSTLLPNARQLKKDVRTIQKIILSHGHYDHSGGLQRVLPGNREVEVHVHPDIFLRRFARIKRDGTETLRQVGVNHRKSFFEKRGARFIFNRSFTRIGEGIYLTGEVPRTTLCERNDPRLVVERNGKHVTDHLLDDQSLVIETAKGLVILLGCAHSGLINTVLCVQKNLSGRGMHAILGGTHLGFLTRDQLEETIRTLKQFSFEKLGGSHCTGFYPAARLAQEFGDRFFVANVGATLEV
jgi:7,8-dihydropterin-6-yl-methyl-4-(beta-D-ribofuranosyl)aminobenzene 5'-phosphate synthase